MLDSILNYLKRYSEVDQKLKLLSTIGSLIINTELGTHTLSETIGKFSIIIMDANSFYDLYSLSHILKYGKIITYLPKDESSANLSLVYEVSFNIYSLNNKDFSELTLAIKTELDLVKKVYNNIKKAESLFIKAQKTLKDTRSGPEISGVSLDYIQKYLKELDEDNSK